MRARVVRLGIEPRLAPRRARRAAAEFDTIMQSMRSILPELHHKRNKSVAHPVGWPGNRSNRKPRHRGGDRFLECHAAFERSRLLARPGTDLRKSRPRRKISVCGSVLDHFDYTAQPNLPIERLPMKE